MVKSIHRVSVIVSQIESISTNIKVYQLTDKDNWELPPFTSGAHVDVHLPSGKIRQYSLCSNPDTTNSYQIAVQKELNGRGGSIEFHEEIEVGQELLLSLPRNTFPVRPETPTVMIAGGIGITPFLSALSNLQKSSQQWHLHYCASSTDAAAFISTLTQSIPASAFTVHLSDNRSRLNIESLISTLDSETNLYCCGPTRMIEDCEKYSAPLGDRLHIEHFGNNTSADLAYEVELASNGQIVKVAVGQTMLQALRAANIELSASCEAGICLECRCRWLKGNPVHRELAMPKADRDEWITPCVSGSDGGRITLDL